MQIGTIRNCKSRLDSEPPDIFLNISEGKKDIIRMEYMREKGG